MADPAPGAGDQYFEAVTQLRSTAKWVIGAFGAIGAALIAGIQLTQLDQVHGGRLWLAVASVVVGVLGVALAIWSTSNVLIPIVATTSALSTAPEFKGLRKTVKEDPSILRKTAGNIEDVLLENESALTQSERLFAALEEDEKDPARIAAYDSAESHLKRVETVINDLLGLGLYLRVHDLLMTARRYMLAGALLAVAGTLGFVYFANPPQPVKPTPSTSARVVKIELTWRGRVRFDRLLGRRCHADDMRAMLDGGTTGAPSVLTFPENGCLGAQLHLKRSLGVIAEGATS